MHTRLISEPVVSDQSWPISHLVISPPTDHRALHSFPTRRSSDLRRPGTLLDRRSAARRVRRDVYAAGLQYVDRKSTRLNSSHGYISYAVFCLKKKKTYHNLECGG